MPISEVDLRGRMRTRKALVSLGLAILVTVPFTVLGNPGGGSSGSFDAPRQMTPEDEAKSAFNRGASLVKQADKTAAAASAATDEKKKAKALDKARKQYAGACDYFGAALQRKPQMHEAWNYVGYTSRKLGEYDKALTAYEEALRLNPTYNEAIEYRGEAYLGLNRIEDAKAAYMILFRDARPLADELMTAMQKWVTERRTDAAGVTSADLDAFAQWVDERTNVARQTASLATDAALAPWN
jgi:tetratricopeptide (TPR) repeat protein